jgi:hypothetical protein
MSDSTVKGAWIQSTAAIVAAIIGGVFAVWVAVHDKNTNPQGAHETKTNSPQIGGVTHVEPDTQKRGAPTPPPIKPNESARPAQSDALSKWRSRRVQLHFPVGWSMDRENTIITIRSPQTEFGHIVLSFVLQPLNVPVDDYLTTHDARYRQLAKDVQQPIRVQRVNRVFGRYTAPAVVAWIGLGERDSVAETALIPVDGDNYLEASLMANEARVPEATEWRQKIVAEIIDQV